MQLIINNKIYTDNSKEANENSVFVVSKQNEKFKDSAIKNGCKEIIDSSELKNHNGSCYLFYFIGLRI